MPYVVDRAGIGTITGRECWGFWKETGPRALPGSRARSHRHGGARDDLRHLRTRRRRARCSDCARLYRTDGGSADEVADDVCPHPQRLPSSPQVSSGSPRPRRPRGLAGARRPGSAGEPCAVPGDTLGRRRAPAYYQAISSTFGPARSRRRAASRSLPAIIGSDIHSCASHRIRDDLGLPSDSGHPPRDRPAGGYGLLRRNSRAAKRSAQGNTRASAVQIKRSCQGAKRRKQRRFVFALWRLRRLGGYLKSVLAAAS